MKTNNTVLGIVAAVMLAGGSSFAQDPTRDQPTLTSGDASGFEFGLRAGYAVPLGSAGGAAVGGGNVSQSDVIKGMIPLWADIGYRFNPNWYLGGFFQFGIGLAPSTGACGLTGVSCSLNDLRFGINAHYHFMPGDSFDPWAGIGAGYEILNQSASVLGTSTSSSLSGFEFGNLQLGGDYKVSPNFGIGPFVAFTFAQYSNTSSGGTSGSITNKTIHEWLMFGVRGVFGLY